MKAKDLMSRDVVTVSPLTEIEAAARLFVERRISGAPVVDEKGNLLGAVSQTDLTRFQGQTPVDGWESEEKGERSHMPVVTVMTDRPVTCDEDASAEEVARLMRERRIHRVFVTHDGRLCGIVSTMDLLRAIPCGAEPRAEGWPL